MQPNNSSGQSPARAAPPPAVPAASPRSLLASLPQDIPRPLTSNEPMIISPPNTGLGSLAHPSPLCKPCPRSWTPSQPGYGSPLSCDPGGLQFPPHPLTLAFLASHNIAPCQLTPNGHRFITCFITGCREVKVAPSLSFLLHVFHVNQSGPFLHLQPMSGYSFVTSLSSLIKNWKEKFVYVSYNPGAAGYGFGTAWVQFVSPFTAPSYEGLDADRAKLCGDGPFDHRRYHDPLLYAPGVQSDDEESLVGVMADPTLDGVESGAIFSPSCAAPAQVITINSPDHTRFDRPTGPPPGSEMVPAPTRFWMDTCPMDALSSHLVGDLMNAIGLQQRLQEASQDYAASEEVLRELGERHQQLQVTHEATLKELDALKTAHTALQLAHSTLQGEHEKQYWLSSPDCSGQAMVDAMSGWYDAQDYQAYLGHPLVQVLQKWAVTAGGKSVMGPVAEVWLRDTDEGHVRVVRECEAAFYFGQREMQDQLYGKLRRCFTSFSIAGWKLPEYIPLRRPPALVMPASTTIPADGFLMSPERAEGTSSVALPSDPVGGSCAVGSVDPSLSLHFTSGSGFSGSAAGSAAP
nr:protein Daple-like [Ipomoea batatas]